MVLRLIVTSACVCTLAQIAWVDFGHMSMCTVRTRPRTKRNLDYSAFFVYKRLAFKTRANIKMSSQKQPMDNGTSGGGGRCGGGGRGGGSDRGGGSGRGRGSGGSGGSGRGSDGGGEGSGCSKWAKATAAATGDEASTSSGAQATAEGVLSLGTLQDDALSSIFGSLPISHDTLQMYANLKAVSRHMLNVTRAQMKDEVLRDALYTLWHTFPGTNIPYRAVTVAPLTVVDDNDQFFEMFQNGSMQWHSEHGLPVSDIFQGWLESFETENEDDDGVQRFCLLVEVGYMVPYLLHPSMVPENPGGMADLSRLPNVIRSSMGLTGLTVPYDSLLFEEYGCYYRAVAVTANTTMHEIFFAIAGVEGWNTDTYDVPFKMSSQTAELDEHDTVMETMSTSNWMLMLSVDWPSLSTGEVAAEPTTFGETTHLQEIADVPPVQEEGAALEYDPDTNEWSYAN